MRKYPAKKSARQTKSIILRLYSIVYKLIVSWIDWLIVINDGWWFYHKDQHKLNHEIWILGSIRFLLSRSVSIMPISNAINGKIHHEMCSLCEIDSFVSINMGVGVRRWLALFHILAFHCLVLVIYIPQRR